MKAKTVYFDDAEAENTDEALQLARKRAEELGIKKIVVSSSSGSTAVKAVNALQGFQVIAVSLATGTREPDNQPFTEENRKIVEDKGGKVVTMTHIFGGLSSAVRSAFNTITLGNLLAATLYILGSGFKVACEVTMIAADGGMVRTDEEIIAIGGTRRGVNTAIVCNPVNASRLFDLRVKEIICKPRF